MGRELFLRDLKNVLYSSHGNVTWGVLWDINTGKDIAEGTVDNLVNEYGDYPVRRIQAQGDTLVFTTYGDIEEDAESYRW